MSNFAGAEDYKHDKQTRIGVMLVNLGTPDDTSVNAVRRYLDEFLSDPRVVESPRFLWWLVMHLFILRFRSRKVARSYKTVWQQKGSPLLVYSQAQADALQVSLDGHFPERYKVSLAMRYGKPAIHKVMEEFRQQYGRYLLVIPMFPQYSATTTASVFDEVTRILKSWRLLPQLRMPLHYHDRPSYIDALVMSIEASWQKNGKGQQLLMSFHGLPQRYHRAGDPYYCECMKTARLLADRLGLEDAAWQVVFQSRFGRESWLQPYLNETLSSLPASGVRAVDVVCPGFAADCLETLEEVAEHNRDLFMNAGGEKFQYIPALNAQPGHIKMLVDIIEDETRNWMPELERYNAPEQMDKRQRRAVELGADE
ncbi:MAG: ferrochelatase [Gammaproteobacteria bacterium]|nr:ferrochelatase [Gammaproteobacteria bacterium]